jgi:hypothetical protein
MQSSCPSQSSECPDLVRLRLRSLVPCNPDISRLESLSPEDQEVMLNMVLEGPAFEYPTNEYDLSITGVSMKLDME